MKIFGWDVKIKKSENDKRVVICPKATNGKVNFVLLEGSDWGIHEKIDMRFQFELWIERIEHDIPSINAKDIVCLLTIFCGERYTFELSE